MNFPPGAPATLLAASAALLLAGCGQKGPLYLPEKRGATVTTPAGAAPVPAGQPVPSPAPQPQSTAEPPSPSGTTAPKKSGPDDDQNPK
jgi:predicted small lipoprotein YifL